MLISIKFSFRNIFSVLHRRNKNLL